MQKSKTQKKVSKTAQKIIDLVISDSSITADNMANKIDELNAL